MGRIRDGAGLRKNRLTQLVDLIMTQHQEPDWDEVRFIGMFMLKTGLTRRKALEYLDDLEYIGHIERKDGRITYLLE